ncbi:MAG: anti-sigma factor family protein [Candidatus Acidiferrales bacterium]
MREKSFHIPDEDLVLAADNELPARRAVEVRAHLGTCWNCRARMAELESTIVDFVHASRESDVDIPRIEGPRALLKARMAQLEPTLPTGHPVHRYVPRLAYVAALMLLAVGGALFLRRQIHKSAAPGDSYALLLPNPSLTPGATQPIALSAMCSSDHDEVVRYVPARVSEAVFREYGISNAPASEYEVDYLITPGLGGADDIRNLWPEPHNDVWNSYVKDQLEDRLHSMVCSDQMTLATAQREIAANWISAYKHYFHTKIPVSDRAVAGRGRGGVSGADDDASVRYAAESPGNLSGQIRNTTRRAQPPSIIFTGAPKSSEVRKWVATDAADSSSQSCASCLSGRRERQPRQS